VFLLVIFLDSSGIPGKEFIIYLIITCGVLVYPLIFARSLVREVPILLQEKDREIESFQRRVRSNVVVELIGADFAQAYGGNDKVLLLWVSVENKGEPTSLKNWRCTIQNSDILLENTVQPHTYAVRQPDGSEATITPYEFIYQKTIDPVPSGARVTGILPVLMRGLSVEALSEHRLKMELRCQDMYGVWIELSQEIGSDFWRDSAQSLAQYS
jgi:hypothetical protein